MGCATGIVKYLVFFANLVFALAGLALVIVGILFKVHVKEVVDALPGELKAAPIISIVVGAIVFIIAFMGCCGAVKESPCMLTTYAVLLLTIFIIQVAIGVYIFIQVKDKKGLQDQINIKMRDIFGKYKQNESSRETVDALQKWMHCCGVEGPSYWAFGMPSSCCRDGNQCSIVTGGYYSDGCAALMTDAVQNNSQVVGGVAIGIAAIEIIGAIFGLCLASSIRNHYRRNIYA